METYRPTLAVHVVWHPRFVGGAAQAAAIFARLFEDPDDLASHGLRIPVRFWRSTSATAEPPPPAVPPLEEAERNAVVVLIDDEFLAADGWPEFLGDLADAATDPGATALLGASLSPNAADFDSTFMDRNLIQLHGVDEPLRGIMLLNRVTHALCRISAGEDRVVRV